MSGFDEVERSREANRYDRLRDNLLDFPDDPQAEPTLEEIKAAGYFECAVDESAGHRVGKDKL